jgi:hypothetical protein
MITSLRLPNEPDMKTNLSTALNDLNKDQLKEYAHLLTSDKQPPSKAELAALSSDT